MPTTILLSLGMANPGVQKTPRIFCAVVRDTRISIAVFDSFQASPVVLLSLGMANPGVQNRPRIFCAVVRDTRISIAVFDSFQAWPVVLSIKVVLRRRGCCSIYRMTRTGST
jgi:hypothetical protein